MNMKRNLLIAGACLAIVAATNVSCNMTMEANPLLAESTAPFGAPQFDQIKDEHYLPAFEQAIAEAKADIDAIVANQEDPVSADGELSDPREPVSGRNSIH